MTEPVVIGLDHIQLAIPPNRESVAERFYCDVLGFKLIPKPAHLAVRGGCWLRSHGVTVHLGVEADFTPARKAHPAFVVSDLKELQNRLEAAEVRIVWDTQISGFERFYAADPFGNRLEFLQRVAESKEINRALYM
jgi:catechol 2,3-dioxygenase-like lactoylglutathione lyase family enzyme